MSDLRWGIIGTGGIARSMAATLQAAGQTIAAVGSARPGASEAFASEFGIAEAMGTHGAVAESDHVDVVYVATTNDRHYENTMDSVRNGKATLCEKSIGLNAKEARSMFAEARDAGVFLMEAMWMRFLPFLATVDELLADGAIGAPRHLQAVFGHPADRDPDRRWMSRELGGGSLLDLGIYPLSLAHHLLGLPADFSARAVLSDHGVDVDLSVISQHDADVMASLHSTFGADTTNEAVLAGAEGRIRIHAPFHHSPRVTVERGDRVLETFDTSYEGNGLRFEVAEVVECVLAGRIESRRRPHAATLDVVEWMDRIRASCGIVFAADAA